MLWSYLRAFRLGKLHILAFTIGFVILSFELTASRIVAPYLGSTIYIWTSIIGVILAALAFGYAIGGIWADNRKRIVDVVALLLLAAVIIAFVGTTKDSFMVSIANNGLPLQLKSFLASLLLFAPPTFLLGATAPYLARMNITSVASSGRNLASINAAETFGSLAGTFITGYFLFSYLGTNTIIFLLSALLVASSFLVLPRLLLTPRLLIGFAVLVAGLFPSNLNASGLIATIDTAYSHYFIRDIFVEYRLARVLQTDENGLQSGKLTDGGDALVFGYTRAFNYSAELVPDAKNYLIIGGGAYTFPTTLAKAKPHANVDVVEIDNRLAAISQEYFDFQQPKNMRLITADGRQYLNASRKQYDILYLDAFTSTTPPFQLMTREAMARLKHSSTDEGIIVLNIISPATDADNTLLQRMYSTLRAEFPHVSAYQVYPGQSTSLEQNVLVVASKKPLDEAAAKQASVIYPEFAGMLQSRINLSYRPSNIMTDNFAPVEHLVNLQRY